ncbi:MAG: DUF3786 domain-containing protein [Candidatus Bathyarchaeota archaeon]|nr:DUF3786 domain-containing protein [Candidatus Bathyarchaeota archaeon]
MAKLDLSAKTAQKLQVMLGKGDYDFLGFTFNTQTCTLTDNLGDPQSAELCLKIFPILLRHYAEGNPAALTGKRIKFRDVPGGYAYEGAFVRNAIHPIEEAFGKTPEDLTKAALRLGGATLSLGDDSTEIFALKGIPLTYILYSSDEFGASANILYDESASHYLPTEDLAVLGELTTSRLLAAKRV